ncbi:hypothetical protein BGX20_003490 [Mortierella sp. AD010]|nr:hypothetical protein BGX20_003490 [Mortierella sp. AD010]
MFWMEQELARRKQPHPAVNSLVTDITLAPPILTPPVDSLSPPTSSSSRWNGGNWEFVNHTATHTSIQQERPQQLPQAPSLARSIHDVVPETNSRFPASIPAHSIGATDNSSLHFVQPMDLNGQASENGHSLVPRSLTTSSVTSKDTHALAYSSSSSSSSSSPLLSQSQFRTPPTPLNNSEIAPVAQISPCQDCILQCARVAAAVAKGDLKARIKCHNAACFHSDLVISINRMVAKLANFTEEVIQVAAQGVEGKLGVQARIDDEVGIWQEFVTHLNGMTVSHSEQVRDIALVCTAVAHGDLSQKITVAVKGETLVLKNTINTMGK